jgi:hypothetical protein
MLVLMLRSHPDILAHGEVFGTKAIGALDGRYARLRHIDSSLGKRLWRYRRRDPGRFLRDMVFDPQGRRTAGFKFKTDEAFHRRNRDVLAMISSDPEVKVIHLRRRDLLAQYVSHRVVLKQGVPTMLRASEDRDVVTMKPFRVRTRTFLAYRADVLRREQRAAETYANHPQLIVDYEDLADENARVLSELAEFLEVPAAPMSAPTQRIIHDHRSLVINVDEVLRAMSLDRGVERGGSAWGQWLADLRRRIG